MARKVTLSDVARVAGVSLATVDRVINGRGGVKPDPEERVLRAARSLGLDRRSLNPPSRLKRIAVLIQPPENPFHAKLAEGIALVRPTFRALNLHLEIHHIAPNAPDRIAAQIAALAGTRDGLVISGPDTPAVAAALRRAAARGPVVTLATDIAESGRAAYVGPDDTRAGRVAGDLIGRWLGPEGGAVLMVAGRLDIAGQRARAEGMAKVLAERHPGVTLAEVVESGEDGESVAGLVRAALRRHPDVRAIYHTTTGAVPLCAAVAAAGKAPRVVIVSHELTPNRRRLLRARQLDAVIDQNPLLEARLSIETMARLLGRLDGAAGSVSTDIQIFMPENA